MSKLKKMKFLAGALIYAIREGVSTLAGCGAVFVSMMVIVQAWLGIAKPTDLIYETVIAVLLAVVAVIMMERKKN